jgi:hypothetical protein
MLKRSGFRQQSLTEIKEKQAIKREKKMAQAKTSPRKPQNALGRVKTKKTVKSTKKPKTAAKLKIELDKVFSIYIRQKFPARCYTCGKTDTALQCGHFVSRQYLATRWHENNCRPQCIGCNMFGNGKPLDFEERLKSELGETYVEEMKKTRHQVLKLDRHWYTAEIEKYKSLIK